MNPICSIEGGKLFQGSPKRSWEVEMSEKFFLCIRPCVCYEFRRTLVQKRLEASPSGNVGRLLENQCLKEAFAAEPTRALPWPQ